MFYELKNAVVNESADLFLYGDIVTEDKNYFSGEKDDNLVGLQSFKEELDGLGDVKNLNIYINTAGGEVFVATTMCSMLQRMKDKGTTIHTYVDGLCASAGTFILMMGDDVNVYENSIVMVHKPITLCYGNADELKKCIDVLDTIENSTMLPLYMKKAKVEESKVRELIDAETWMGGEEACEIFDFNLIKESKKAVACASNLYANYKNVPEMFKAVAEEEEPVEEPKEEPKEAKFDYTEYEQRLIKIRR